MSRSNARATLAGPAATGLRVAAPLVLLLCSLLAGGCASRQQVEKLEERLVSMDDTLQQMATGQEMARTDTASRLDLIEDYLVAEGKEKARLLQDIKARRQLRAASTRAVAEWTPPAAQDHAQKSAPGQPIPTFLPDPTPVPPPAPPAAPPASPAPPVAGPISEPVAPLPVAPLESAPGPGAAEAPEVVKRRVSKPVPRVPGQGMNGELPEPGAGEAIPGAAPLELDPNRVVSKPIVQYNTPGAAGPAAPAATAAKGKPAVNPTASYEEAVKLIQAGKIDRGRQLLNAYIQENPKGAMLPNAYYWLGETYYHDKRYAQAILTFKEVTARFPKHDKAAAALLKIGYAYEQLGDKPNARFYLGTLVKEYPRSGSAGLAKDALQGRLK
ncbi:MAG: tol-pal system protein YbgF [Desulfovibrio sp.]|nr:tol-pal system protein YbgF [Desulfovibrio sp.]MCA1984864.1 tol-pal system protein YbgF [Desulfovibrio sp.]